MMRKLFILLLLLLMAMTFNSCKKEKLIKNISIGDFYYEFYYDNQQRIKNIIFRTDSERGYSTYSYDNNSITVNDDGEISVYTLDNNGYVIKGEWSDLRNYGTYEYSNGYVAKSKIYWNNDTYTEYTYTWQNGNLTKVEEKSYDKNSKLVTTTSYIYIYDNNVENKMNLNIYILYDFNIDSYFYKFKGQSSKNLPIFVKRESVYNYTYYNYTINYYYTFDSDGYPTEIVYDSGDTVLTIPITYY